MASIKSHEVKYIFLAVQNSSIGDLVTDSLSFFDIKERSKRLVTFETTLTNSSNSPHAKKFRDTQRTTQETL